MPDETLDIGSEQEVVTEPEGSDSLTADAGDDAGGASAESPTAGSKGEPGEWIPRSRLNEVIEERNQLRETLNSRVADQWQQFQAAKREPQKPQEPLFDDETDRRLDQKILSRLEPGQQLTRAELAQVRAELNEIKVAKANKDWDTMKPQVLSEYDRLRQSSFSGPDMVQVIIDAARYRSGAPVREAVEQARRREDTKLKAAGPSGRPADHGSEAVDWDDPKLDINEAIERVKAGQWK